MNTKKTITTTYCPHVLCVIGLFFVIFFVACNYSEKESEATTTLKEISLPHSEKATIDAENIFFVFLSKIAVSDKVSDSLLIVWDNGANIVHYFDTSLTLVKSLKLPQGISDIKSVDYFNDNYYLLKRKEIVVYNKDFTHKLESYSFNYTDASDYSIIGSTFNVLQDSSLYLLKHPKVGSIANKRERTYYFNSKLIAKAKLNTNPLAVNSVDIPFPEQYRLHYFNDVYPKFYFLGNSFVYTFGYWDSLAFLNQNQVERYAIPKQFSVKSQPFPIEDMGSVTKSKEYSATTTSNINLLYFKNKIILFQRIAAKSYVDEETGMIDDYISASKRAVVFDMESKQFEQAAYLLPVNSNPIKTIIFNGKIYLLSSDEAQKKLLINQIPIN